MNAQLNVEQSPVRKMHHNTYALACLAFQEFADQHPLPAGLRYLAELHSMTGFRDRNPIDLNAKIIRGSHRGSTIEAVLKTVCARRRALRSHYRKDPPDGLEAIADGCPLARPNVYWQQFGEQIPYRKLFNNRPYNILVQVAPFADLHCTVASAEEKPQDWRPSVGELYAQVLDMYAMVTQSGLMAIRNGVGAAASIDWLHFHLLSPGDEPIPICHALNLAAQTDSGASSAVSLRLDEPYWPLVAFRIHGNADDIACEVIKLASRCAELAGENATESIAMYPEQGCVTCIFVPRDRRKERAETFGVNVGASETAIGSLVFSDPAKCAEIEAGRYVFGEFWAMLREVRPEWSDAI